MSTKRLPILGFSHLSIAAQANESLDARFLAALNKAGFIKQTGGIAPPTGLTGREIITAITTAFQSANSR